MKKRILFILLFLLVPIIIYAQLVGVTLTGSSLISIWSYEQDFDALNTATIVGQDSYVEDAATGSATMEVQEAITFDTTTKALEIACTVSVPSRGSVTRAVGPFNKGTIYFAAYFADRSALYAASICFRDNGAAMSTYACISTDTSANALLSSSGVDRGDIVTSFAEDTWYRFGLEFDTTKDDGQVRANVNGGAWSGWFDIREGVTTYQIDELKIELSTGALASEFYIDEIQITELAAP